MVYSRSCRLWQCGLDGNPRWLNIGVRPGVSSGSFTNLFRRQPVTATPYAITAANLSGPLPSANLSGTYANALTLNNAANSFAGNGAGLTSLNAANLQGSIATPGKVANSATTATSANTANAIVARDGSGYFSASGIHWAASELSADQRGAIELGNARKGHANYSFESGRGGIEGVSE